MHVYSWSQKGNIYLWRYEGNPRDYSGWHFSTDREGAKSLLNLLNAMLKSENDCTRTIKLSLTTTDVLDKVGCTDKAISSDKLKLRYEIEEDIDWRISVANGGIEILFDKRWLKYLIKGVNDILVGKGDYYIGHDNNQLWFWWCSIDK